jgi:phage shock protein C
VAGVCGGLAEYFHADPTVVRLLWAILTVIPGAIVLGVVAYLVAWFIMPIGSQVGSPEPSAVQSPA